MRRVKKTGDKRIVIVEAEIRALDNKTLTGLNKLLKNSEKDYLDKFVRGCVKKIERAILTDVPDGKPADYFRFGYRRGLLEAHKLYLRLGERVSAEIENRAEKEEEKVQA